MSRQFWAELLTWLTASGTPVANTLTETVALPNITLPSGFMDTGRTLWINVLGQYSTTATPTIIFTNRWGGVAGTVLNKTAACTLPTITAGLWQVETFITARSYGSSGTLMANGFAVVGAGVAGTVASATGASLVTAMTAGGVLTPAVATVDLTVDSALSAPTITWSAASASNTATTLQAYLMALN